MLEVEKLLLPREMSCAELSLSLWGSALPHIRGGTSRAAVLKPLGLGETGKKKSSSEKGCDPP